MPSTILSDNGVSSGSAGLKTTAASDGALALQTTTAGGSATTAVYVDTSQNVGIGTSSPVQKLQVLAVNGTGFAGAAIQNQNTNVGIAGVQFSSDTTYFKSAIGHVRNDSNGVGSLVFYNASSTGAANWSTSDARMTLDSSGNLGLGVTPSGNFMLEAGSLTAAGRSFKLMTLTGGFSGGNYPFFGYNFRSTTTSGTYRYDGNDVASAINFASGIAFNIATSGTAGNAITWNQAMTLDASGRLQIGTTSTGAGQRLIVDSNGASTVYNSNFTFSGTTNTAYCATTWTHGQSGTATGYVGVGGSAVSNNAFANNFVVGTQSSSPLVFNTNDTERARINSSGIFMVGKTTNSATSLGVELTPDGQGGFGNAATSNATITNWVYSTGAGAFRFYVGLAGTVYATSTTITGISDQRLKENIRDLDDGLEKVMALQPRKFDWKEGKGQDIKNARGFIAQEFEQVFPDMVEEWQDPAPEGEEPYKAVNANLIPTLVKAIQELKAIVDAQAAEIAALKGN